MKSNLPLLIFSILFLLGGKAIATKNNPIGAKAAAMGNATVAVADVWSLYHNQAGLANLEKLETGIYYENRYMVPELSLRGFVLAMPLKGGGVVGTTVTHYGFALYSETKVGVAYAQKLSDRVSAGVQLNYLNTFIGEGYGSKNMVTAEAGVMAELVDGLTLGAHIYNPTRARLSHYDNERVPTIMRLGLNYILSQKASICVETLKDTDQKPMFKVGMEYQVVDNVYLRAGVSSNPSLNSFGFGFNFKQIKFDFASSFHSVLGYSPQVGLSYRF